MRIYLALGDSISIDDYTGVPGGGAPSQLARNWFVDVIEPNLAGATAIAEQWYELLMSQ